MFLLNVFYALGCILIAFSLYLFISWKDPGVSWGGAFDAISLYSSYKSVLNLGLNNKQKIGETIGINWRPSFLLLHLINSNNHTTYNNDGVTYFVETLRKGHSLIFAVQIIISEFQHLLRKMHENNNITTSGYLPQNIHHQVVINQKESTDLVIRAIQNHIEMVFNVVQMTGLGILRPNTLIMAMFNEKTDDIKVDEYVEILRDTLLSGCGIMICCGFNANDGNKINWQNDRFQLSKNAENIMSNDIIDIFG